MVAVGSLVVLATLAFLLGPPVAASAVPRFSAPMKAEVGVAPAGMVAADLDRDGRPDLATEEFVVLLGVGAGRFKIVQRYTGAGTTDLAVGDLNGDGHLDVAHGTTHHADPVAVRLGLGDGAFGPAVAYRSGSDTYAVALAGLDQDDSQVSSRHRFGRRA